MLNNKQLKSQIEKSNLPQQTHIYTVNSAKDYMDLKIWLKPKVQKQNGSK